MSILNSKTPVAVYVAGPMQGIPEFNFPRFNAVSWALKWEGHTVFNPAERDVERHGGVNIAKGNMEGSLDKAKASHGFSLRQALADDTAFICNTANWIVMLPGWERSNGAQAEHRLAVALQGEGMQIRYLTTDECNTLQLAHGQYLDSEAKAA